MWLQKYIPVLNLKFKLCTGPLTHACIIVRRDYSVGSVGPCVSSGDQSLSSIYSKSAQSNARISPWIGSNTWWHAHLLLATRACFTSRPNEPLIEFFALLTFSHDVWSYLIVYDLLYYQRYFKHALLFFFYVSNLLPFRWKQIDVSITESVFLTLKISPSPPVVESFFWIKWITKG